MNYYCGNKVEFFKPKATPCWAIWSLEGPYLGALVDNADPNEPSYYIFDPTFENQCGAETPKERESFETEELLEIGAFMKRLNEKGGEGED